jgi:hypothetical protein
MLRELETLLQAAPQVTAFHVIDHDAIDEENFLVKIRCQLASGHILQIRLRAVAGTIRYSYQEFSDKPLRRWDNAPHFPHLPGFPHHYHNAQGDVTEAVLTGNPITDLEQVLSIL